MIKRAKISLIGADVQTQSGDFYTIRANSFALQQCFCVIIFLIYDLSQDEMVCKFMKTTGNTNTKPVFSLNIKKQSKHSKTRPFFIFQGQSYL